MESCLKSIFYSCALLVYTVSFSRGQRHLSEFSSTSPALCGKTKIVNGENSFFFNEVLSTEARSQASFHERSKGMKHFSNLPGNRLGSENLPSWDTSRSLGSLNPRNSNNPNFSASGYKNKQYRKKVSRIDHRLPKYKSKFSFPTHEPTTKPPGFSNFMRKKFTQPFKNEMRRFPEEPPRIATTKKPKIKPDMLSGLSGKVEGKKKKNSSHSNHRDKHSKLPPMIQHIIEKKKQKSIAPVDLSALAPTGGHVSPYHPPGPITDNSVVGPVGQGRSMPMGPMGSGVPGSQMGPAGSGSGWMDVLGSLGPDKIQKLKQLLGRMDNGPEETESGLKIPVRRVLYEAENRRMEGGGASRGNEPGNMRMGGEGDPRGDEVENRRMGGVGIHRDNEVEHRRMGGGGTHRGDVYELHPNRPRGDRRRRPQSYNLDRYGENRDGGADLRSRNRYGNGGDIGLKDPELYPETDFASVPNPDVGEMDEGSINRRVKRSLSLDGRGPPDTTDVKSCTWVFRKGNMCKRMVIKMQYWVDGVRDCSKEYLQISGSQNANSPSDKLCGGQESLAPYIVEGDEVSIKHFRDTVDTRGVTKFKGMIQCEQ